MIVQAQQISRWLIEQGWVDDLSTTEELLSIELAEWLQTKGLGAGTQSEANELSSGGKAQTQSE